ADRSTGVCRGYFSRRSFCHADHHRPAARTQRIGGVHRAVVLDLAVGTDGRLPVIAAFDRGACSQGAPFAGDFVATAAGLTGTSGEAKRLFGMSFQSFWMSAPGAFDVKYGR